MSRVLGSIRWASIAEVPEIGRVGATGINEMNREGTASYLCIGSEGTRNYRHTKDSDKVLSYHSIGATRGGIDNQGNSVNA